MCFDPVVAIFVEFFEMCRAETEQLVFANRIDTARNLELLHRYFDAAAAANVTFHFERGIVSSFEHRVFKFLIDDVAGITDTTVPRKNPATSSNFKRQMIDLTAVDLCQVV
ncbi:hypothetical protein D3C86_1653230 [compost metagenome]